MKPNLSSHMQTGRRRPFRLSCAADGSVFDLTLKGRKLTVTAISSRRSADELLAEFVEIFGDQIRSLH